MIKTVCLALLLAACSGANLTHVDDEELTGGEVAQQVEEQVGVYPAEYLTAYVDAIGRRLVAGLDKTPYYFRFSIIDRGEPNAFAAPGGYIYVTRGLLALINSEDELAGILAHEIIHVSQQHHAHQAVRNTRPDILKLPGSAIGKVIGADIDNTLHAPLEAVGAAYFDTYDGDQEKEAIDLGTRLSARAGYDPSALADVLHNLDRTLRLLTEKQKEAGFFASHPISAQRIAQITRQTRQISWTPSRPFALDKQDLLNRLNGLPWGTDNPMQGVLHGRLFMQPDLDVSIRFPAGWKSVNTPVFVGAFAPENQALIILGSAGKPGTATELAAAFTQKLRSKADLEPAESHPVKLDAGPAYLVRIEDTTGEEPVSIFYLWVNTRNTTFRFIAAGAESFRPRLRDTVLSLRKMTAEEKVSMVEERIQSVTANAGETIQALSDRTANVFSPELTAAVNGLPDDVILQQNQLIKILRRTPYFR